MEEEKHKGLPVAGYRAQSDKKVEAVNGFKADEERILRKLDAMRNDDEIDPRLLASGRTYLEIAFMLINRSVFRPGRVTLPEDVEAIEAVNAMLEESDEDYAPAAPWGKK